MWLLSGWTWKLKPLGSRPIMPKNIPGHWSTLVLHCIQPLLAPVYLPIYLSSFITWIKMFEIKFIFNIISFDKVSVLQGHGIQNCYRWWNSIFFVPITMHLLSYCYTSHTMEEEISTKMPHAWERIEQYSRGANFELGSHQQSIGCHNFNKIRTGF